ncbi:OTU domain-containing protein 5-like isoform X2 [Babylonia areolata]|uniref:OTU domain-containing protein 5-like isoform X2 n=1 Tax=Babylonia areolata TaxID=304850 RepID=UPI003FD09C75
MTILPKKKATKDKNDPENPEHQHAHSGVGHPHPHQHNHTHTHSHTHGHTLNHPHAHGHYHHTTATDTRLEKAGRGRTSPTSARWGPSTSREEKLHPSTPAFEFDLDFENHDSSCNHKRRHRSPPHRSVRKHRGAHSGHSSSSQASPGQSGAYELEDGYNSEDEHTTPRPVAENREELERWFEQALKEKKGFIIKKMGEDGACLFRAVADQIYGDQEMNSVVRNMCIDYMAKNAEFFSQYVTEDFQTYLNRKRMDDCHGNHLEIQAIAELFNRPVDVYQYSIEPINTFQSTYKTDNEPIRISYHRAVHYNSVVDPYKATIGVGLGLPGYQPGTMLEDKMRETDWELTQESIEEQVARESYLQWLTEQEATSKTRTQNPAASATCSSASEYSRHMEGGSGSPEARTSRSPRTRSGQSSPQHPATVDIAVPGSSKSPRCSPKQQPPSESTSQAACSSDIGAVGGGFSETSSLMDHLPMYDWEEDDIMAQVMALSHQEYLDSLKRKATPSSSSASATITTSDARLEEAGCSTSTTDPGFPYCDS